MITFKAIHGMAPSNLSNLICIRSSSRCSLRSNDTKFLERSKGVMCTTLGARLFHASVPCAVEQLAYAHKLFQFFHLATFQSPVGSCLKKLILDPGHCISYNLRCN